MESVKIGGSPVEGIKVADAKEKCWRAINGKFISAYTKYR